MKTILSSALATFYSHKLVISIYILSVIFHTYFGFTHVIFSQDQGRDISLAKDAVNQGELIAAYGPKTSVGSFYVLPLYYQLYRLVAVISEDPLAMGVLVILIESLTPVFLFLILKRLKIDTKVAWLTSFCYIVAWYATLYSSHTWSPNLLLSATTIALWSWLEFSHSRKPWLLIIGTLSAAAAVHYHFQSLTVIPFIALFAMISLFKKPGLIKYWIIGALLAFLTITPYILTEFKTNWPNTRNIISFYQVQNTQYFDRVSKPEYITTFYPSLFERVLFNTNYHKYWFGSVIFFGGLLTVAYGSLRNTQYRLLLLYILSVIASVRMFKGDKLDYYLMVTFIFPFLFIGILLKKTPRLGSLLLTVLSIVSIYYLSRVHHYDQLRSIDRTTQFIAAQHSEPIYLIFHNFDVINSFAYSFKYNPNHTIKLSDTSKTVVEICESFDQCDKVPYDRCINSTETTFANLYKVDNGYQLQSEYSIDDRFKVLTGTVKSTNTVKYAVYSEKKARIVDLLLDPVN